MSNISKFNSTIRRYFLVSFLLVTTACGQGMNEHQTMQSAKNHLNQGDPKTASIELRNVLQINGENAEARFLLGDINLQFGDLEGAMKEFNRAVKSGWNDEQIQPKIALILLAQARFDELLKTIISQDDWSDAARANVAGLRAIAEASLGHTALAKNTLKRGASIEADALHILRATSMFQLSGLLNGDATRTTEKALSLYPDNIELLFLYATIDRKNNNLSRASDTYKKIIDLTPANTTTLYSQKASINLARLEMAQQNIIEAKAILATLLSRNEDNPEANYLSGLLAFSEKDFARAEEYLQKLFAIAPNHPLSQQLMGKIKYALNEDKQASHYFIEYLKIVPDDYTAQKLLAHTYIRLNQPEKALPIVQSLLTRNSTDPGALGLQSQLKFIKGDINAGILSLKKALTSNSENSALREQLIKAYIANGKTEQALKEINTYLNINKNTVVANKLTISAYVQSGNTDKAINIARKMLENNPGDAEALSLNGALHASQNDDDLARDYFTQALRQQDNFLPATQGLARLEIKEGNLDKAIKLYNGLIESNKGGALPMLALSELAAKQQRTNDMLSWLEKARDTFPSDTRSRILLANYYLNDKLLNKANMYLQEAIILSPDHVEVLALQGKILISQKRFNEALPPLKRLANKLPDPTIAKILLAEAYINLAMTNEALTNLRTAVKTQPENYLAVNMLAGTELQVGNHHKSLVYSKQLQQQKPLLPIGYLREGNVWMAKQNYKKANMAYQNAWNKQPSADLAIRLFTAATHYDDFDIAIKPLLAWLDKNPDDNSVRLFLASQYQRANKNDLATREYEIILSKEPEHTTSLNNLAWLYSLKGHPKALDTAERAYRSAPENSSVQDTYGWILVQQNQTIKGIRLLKQAMDISPEDLDIRYHYAVALLNTENKDEGRKILEQILAQGNSFNSRAEAKELLGNLEPNKNY